MRVLAVVLALGAVSGCGPEQPEHPAGAVPYPPEVQAELDRQITDDAFVARAFRAAVAESRIKSELRPEDVRVSSYRGKPTACGKLVDSTGAVRFIYRDGGAVVESNQSPDVFEEFWGSICPLPLQTAPPSGQ